MAMRQVGPDVELPLSRGSGETLLFKAMQIEQFTPGSFVTRFELPTSRGLKDLVSFPGARLSCRSDLAYAEAGCRIRSGSQGTGPASGILSRAPR